LPEAYAPPLDKLFALGNAWEMRRWPDYLVLGFGPEHVPDLIQMALDPQLNEALSDSTEVWAPAHAWRTLAQLHAAEAAAPLTVLFQRIHDNDDEFVTSDLPEAFGILGPAAIPVLAEYMASSRHGLFARCAAASSLREIGERHTEARQTVVEALAAQLGRADGWAPELNGFVAADLITLEAIEAAPALQAAFDSNRIETGIAGDWEDVQIALGLKMERGQPRVPSKMMQEVTQVAELLDQLGALENFDEAAPASTDKPMPYRKLAPEPEHAPSGKRRRHHKRT
jgi:hypothetical protein